MTQVEGCQSLLRTGGHVALRLLRQGWRSHNLAPPRVCVWGEGGGQNRLGLGLCDLKDSGGGGSWACP